MTSSCSWPSRASCAPRGPDPHIGATVAGSKEGPPRATEAEVKNTSTA
ncbi:MAG: hypothetical protein U0326_40050 [Polyangiales bacterium]